MNAGAASKGHEGLGGWAARVVATLRLRWSTDLAAKTALSYCVGAALWITFSDTLLFHLTRGHHLAWLGLVKGWLFVLVTAGWLRVFLRRKLDVSQAFEQKLRLFVDHAPVALAMLDRELCYVTVSQRWRTLYGCGDREVRGRTLDECFPDVPPHWREVHRRGLAGETTTAEAERLERPDRAVQWLRWEVRPWFDASGAVGGIVVFTEDITRRKETEEALAASQASLRIALQSGRVGTWSRDLATGVVTCDEAIANLTGRDAGDFTRGGAEFFLSCVHPDDRALVRAARENAVRQRVDYFQEFRIVQPDGCVLWIADRAAVEQGPDGRAVRMNGAAVDITEMKRIGSALHESEERLREVVETMREVFWIRDLKLNAIVYVSPRFEDLWGLPRKSVYASDRVWVNAIHPCDRDRMLKAVADQAGGGTGDETYRVIRPDGSERWVHDRSFPVRDAKGTVVRVVGTAEDITERKKLEEQFLRAQRLEAIGTLASGVAHDLNNILAPMLMIGPLLKPKLADPTDVHMLGIVEQSAKRGADVVRQLLTFSRGITGEKRALHVAPLIEEMNAIVRETFPRDIAVLQEIAAGLPAIVGDTTQLHQVLMNLCVNARDAMPDGGQLTIAASEVVLPQQDVAVYGGMKAGRFVVLTVRDTGHGIPADLRSRVFEPFFTTKELGKGTGLGLSTIVGILKSHGGFVTLESEIDVGSAFHVHLPVHEFAATPDLPVAVTPRARGHGEVILVIDDEPGVRAGTQQVLERQGYTVLTAANGREGLGVFLLQQRKIRAVITDLMMPEMGGVTLVRALRELSLDLAILVATGLDDHGSIASLAELGVSEILRKPYSPDRLIDALEREMAAQNDPTLHKRAG